MSEVKKPNFLSRLSSLFGGEGSPMQAASAELPPAELPKVKKGQMVLPSHLKTAKPNPKSALLRDDQRLYNTDLTTLRQGVSTYDTIKKFVRSSPDLSASVTSYIRTAITSEYTAIARNMDGTCNPEATSALAQIITRMDVMNDYTIGYDDSMSLRSLCEAWAKEMMQYGAMAGELVLNDVLLPDKFQPVSVSQIKKYPSSDGKKMIPHQEIAGQDIVLDQPTFFMVSIDQDILDPYPQSPIESAIQGVIFSIDFMNDIRRMVKRVIHPRMVVSIDEEKFRKAIPQDLQHDKEGLKEYMDATISGLADEINGLEPDEALVVFDSIEISYVDHGNTNLSNEYEVLNGMADAKMRAGAKTMPTVVGQSGGTSNVASSESLMFVKYVEGTLWGKLNEMLSKMFTLGVRLLGHDVYVEFRFGDIDLRPKSELESFRAMKQSRILEQLSYGFITDEDASIQLTGHLPPPGFKPLSGTLFFNAKVAPAGDGYNGASNSGSTLNQNLKSDAPSGGARGQNKKADGNVIPLQ